MHPINLIFVVILGAIQGLAELLPVSSSAHVIVAEKLMKIDPSWPEATVLLVMLHTGTMFAVIVYFWKAWKASIFASKEVFKQQAIRLLLATIISAIVLLPIKVGIEKLTHSDIESLFSNLPLVAAALAAAGALILVGGLAERTSAAVRPIGYFESGLIGAIQGLSVPFRGFSRSGATISVGMILGCAKTRVEEFSFAMAVIITPAVVGNEIWRLIKAVHKSGDPISLTSMFGPSLIGMVAAFFAGLLALRWLSGWLEHGRWYLFGIYCLVASAVVAGLAFSGY
jgi:undecaprenyl-diphosphatase